MQLASPAPAGTPVFMQSLGPLANFQIQLYREPVSTDPDRTALALQAAKNGAYMPIATQLARGANVDGRDINGTTVLHHAAASGNMQVLELAVRYRCDLNLQTFPDVGASTALHLATKAGHAALARRLVELGAALDIRDSQGFSPLMLAARFGQLELARLFIEKGADVTLEDARGRTAHYWATEHGHKEIAALLPSVKYDWLAVARRDDERTRKLPHTPKPKPKKEKGKGKGKGKGKK